MMAPPVAAAARRLNTVWDRAIEARDMDSLEAVLVDAVRVHELALELIDDEDRGGA